MVHQSTEELDVQTGGRGGRGPPLHSQSEPVVAVPLDGLDDTVQGAGANAEAAGRPTDRLAMLAVDDDFALSIKPGKLRTRLNDDGVPQAMFRRMPMLQRLGQFAGQI